MFEKVNKFHPDKLADRIAGAITDCCVGIGDDARVAVEVLLGHGACKIIGECSLPLASPEHRDNVFGIVERIAGPTATEVMMAKQDARLSDNQKNGVKCGDNGIFKGVKPNEEEMLLAKVCATLEADFPSDGKYIIDARKKKIIVCQSNASEMKIRASLCKIEALEDYDVAVNPLGEWTGGADVDAGAVNRKLGSDMGRAVTGGGLWGKDLSKADVTLNIVCHMFSVAVRARHDRVLRHRRRLDALHGVG